MKDSFGLKEFRPAAFCLHGDHLIERLDSGIWVDERGWTTCVKAAEPGAAGQIPHAPMPQIVEGDPRWRSEP